jgi:hypothetical protein
MTKLTTLAITACGAILLAACTTSADVKPAGAGADRQALNPDCRPGNTPAGTASGLRCTTGSNTGEWPGLDANVEGASTYGQTIAPPAR